MGREMSTYNEKIIEAIEHAPKDDLVARIDWLIEKRDACEYLSQDFQEWQTMIEIVRNGVASR
jgi:hypothetical protein